ncbi:MAG: hypothetical protein NTZ97_01970 [Candidatus Moranbacteria bacterium]|nr:hypothetical protein [Candidatus Moranbacteria bacterium]
MILATHALVGAAIGKNINNPWLIGLSAIIIHFILDTFRHGEYLDSRVDKLKNTWWKILIDLSTAGLIILAALYHYGFNKEITINILVGAFFSLLPDSVNLFYWLFRWKFLKPLYNFHVWVHLSINKIQKFAPERQWNLRNAANDIIFSIIAIILLFI